MRRIIMFNRISADGYFADAGGSLGWIVPEPAFDRAAARRIGAGGVDTILFGRRTYQMFESFWPHVLDDSATAPDPHHRGRRSPEMRAMARMLNEAKKLVFSTTLKQARWHNSRVVAQFDPAEIRALKKRRGTDIMIFGSGSIVSQLSEHGLIDEYQFLVAPVLLGMGKQLIYSGDAFSTLELLDAKAYPLGNVAMRYRRRSQNRPVQ
jgi:dihydrofolate reductase